MNKFFFLLFFLFLFKQILLSNPCTKIDIKPFESNEIFIQKNIQTYYFVIFENDFYFKDDLIIYNDKFEQNNYYEISKIEKNQRNELNFKDKYTENNPIIIHLKTPSKDINYLNYQFVNINGKVSFYIYKINLDIGEKVESVEDKKENNNYILIESDTDYYIKIFTDGEINLIFDFLDTKVMKITPEDIFEKEIITSN